MLLIQNSYLIDPASGTEGRRDILIDNGRFVKIQKNLLAPAGVPVIDAGGMIACPGLIDTHSHFRDPGFTYKEDLQTGAEAAIKGGYTSIILMANTKPPVDSVDVLGDILSRGRDLPVHLYSCANVTKGMAGQELCDLKALADCGAAGFTDDGLPLCGTRSSWLTQMRWSPSRPENRKERLTPFGKWSKLVKTSKLLKYDLKKNGLSTSDIESPTMKVSSMNDALKTDGIDAMLTYEPYVTISKEINNQTLVENSADILPDHPCCVVIMNEKFLSNDIK